MANIDRKYAENTAHLISLEKRIMKVSFFLVSGVAGGF